MRRGKTTNIFWMIQEQSTEISSTGKKTCSTQVGLTKPVMRWTVIEVWYLTEKIKNPTANTIQQQPFITEKVKIYERELLNTAKRHSRQAETSTMERAATRLLIGFAFSFYVTHKKCTGEEQQCLWWQDLGLPDEGIPKELRLPRRPIHLLTRFLSTNCRTSDEWWWKESSAQTQ